MTKIDKTKGKIIWTPPTVDPFSDEAKKVEVGERVGNILPKKVGDLVLRKGVFYRVTAIHPVEYKKKYGKEWSYAHKKPVQTYSVWTGDYRYTLQEVIYNPDWQFNVGEACLYKDSVGVVRERHGTVCPWYKVEFENGLKVLYEVALDKVKDHLVPMQMYKDTLASLAMERGMVISGHKYWRQEVKKERSNSLWSGICLGFVLAVFMTILLL